MREIVLDTETTGLNPLTGDRLVEIGCVELANGIPTGVTWHEYFNPQRSMPAEAEAIHGLSDAFLADKPEFENLADAFLDFIGDARLVIHNASFDIGFLNMELQRCGRADLAKQPVLDTLALARTMHPGGSNRLDDLCTRYGIDNSRRTVHGALLDSELLAEVYIELNGGRQTGLELVSTREKATAKIIAPDARPAPLPQRLTADEQKAHQVFVETLGPDALWNRYFEATPRKRG